MSKRILDNLGAFLTKQLIKTHIQRELVEKMLNIYARPCGYK